MNKEQYVTFEVCKLLKDKGFDWDCEHYYKPNGEIVRTFHANGSHNINSSVLYEHQCLAPTQQMACDWLREEHEIDIIPIIRHSLKYAQESPFRDYACRVYDSDGNIVLSATKWYSRYENAIEAALEYCLKNII